MTHVITQHCCNDTACVDACPVDCIHPRPDEPGFTTADILYIDPQVCIDCGACVQMCPVDCIRTAQDLGDDYARYADINAFFAAENPPPTPRPDVAPTQVTAHGLSDKLRVAVVGAGPAGLYTAEHLLTEPGVDVEVDVFDRLPTPGGLIRAGVAPDHSSTKFAAEGFRYTANRPGFRYQLNVEVGRDISHAELMEHFHAVIYAVGAMSDRKLDLPGEELRGSHTATEFVAWYNGHPDYSDRVFDLSGDRAVIVGNGNVALDAARILVADTEKLARTEIADHALEALQSSRVREVIVLGRRGPLQAAYTSPEFEALGRLDGVDIMADPDDVMVNEDDLAAASPAARLKVRQAREFATTAPSENRRRIVFRYFHSPVQILGDTRVEGLRIVRNELTVGPDGAPRATPTKDIETIDTQLVLRSIGNRGTPLRGLPFDERRGIIPNEDFRVLDDNDAPLPGTYTTGWIQRGPSGFIGTNKMCAADTVTRVFDDALSGRLSRPICDRRSLQRLLEQRRPDRIDQHGWSAIDRHERSAGAATGRPRVKVVDIATMLHIASETP